MVGAGDRRVSGDEKEMRKNQKGIFKCLIRNLELVGYKNPYKTE